MPADRIHLVRHGEVHNPGGVLYGRLPGFRLSDLGRRMARAAAESSSAAPVVRVVASPLQRTRESAAPWGELFRLDVETDARLLEPWNAFEGSRVRREIRRPRNWRLLARPWVPGWGEAYASIAERMLDAMAAAAGGVDGGDVVLVSHQLPIWIVHRAVARQPFPHDPRRRRCALSSITTFEPRAAPAGRGRSRWRSWTETDYREPARELLSAAVDLGAV
ncbi:MAG: histidine phosphatase family protein [Micrococcales bacterium]|nr:histidine phosphatase family protein [Micrococcales bacterium]